MLQAAGKRVLSVKRALIGSPVLVSPVINGQTTNSKRKQTTKLLTRRRTTQVYPRPVSDDSGSDDRFARSFWDNW